LHSFDFAYGLACVSASKGKCVQCAVAIKLKTKNEWWQKMKLLCVGSLFWLSFRLSCRQKCLFNARQFDVSTIVIGFPVTFVLLQWCASEAAPCSTKPNVERR